MAARAYEREVELFRQHGGHLRMAEALRLGGGTARGLEVDGVRVRETHTHVRPDMTKVPVAGAMQKTFEDNVPLAGPMAKAMRNTGEAMMGRVFEGVHALMAGKSPGRMAQSIDKKRKQGFW